MNRNDRMLDEVRAFVAEKDAFDKLGRQYAPATLRQKIRGFLAGMLVPNQGWTAVMPSAFVRSALPFSQIEADRCRMVPTQIDPLLIISGTFNNYADSPDPPAVVMEWSDKLATTANIPHPGSPRAARVGSFPLLVSTEGKNRVELFKRAGQKMGVLVTPMPYPPANELTLYRSWPFGIYTLAHRSQRKVLPFPRSVVPLLQEYGVGKVRRCLSCWDPVRLIKIKRSLCRWQMRR